MENYRPGLSWFLVLSSCWLVQPVLISCAGATRGAPAKDLTPGLATTGHEREIAVGSPETGDAPSGASEERPADAGATPGSTRHMIYTARLELLVASIEDARGRLVTVVNEQGGYLQERQGDSVTCRVPATRFGGVLATVRGLGKVIEESQRALDVTRSYRDIQIQLENAQEARARLLELFQRAEKVEDLLQIEEQLRRLTTEIERLKGELEYLSDQIALSTIEVLFRSNAPALDPQRSVRSRFWWINQVGVDHVLDYF